MVYWMATFSMTLNNPWPSVQGHAILWRRVSHKRLKIRSYSYCGRRIGNCTQSFEWYYFKWPCVNSNLFQGRDIIQRQIIKTRYSIEYLQWRTNRKLLYDLSNGAIFNDLERPLPPFSRSRHFLTLDISKTVRHTNIHSMKYWSVVHI